MRSENVTINADVLVSKATEIAKSLFISDFKASTGWLASFIKRNCLKSKKIYGEVSLVNDNLLEGLIDTLKIKISEYEEKNIFNCDKTGLFTKKVVIKPILLIKMIKAIENFQIKSYFIVCC
ncbi:Tigger transposable element-derived protein 6 [Dictyocoela muelleri]|nr:Tigger transposable element-derived protein 6 [Dictyocoela muelleri]